MSKNSQSAFKGTIIAVRAVEDCIRATKKYTEGVGTIRVKHPVQGEGQFPSKKFVKYYEVYPEVEVSWNMPANVAIDWLWGETPCIDVLFRYDYRENKAEIIVRDGPVAVKQLAKTIPGFSDSLARVVVFQSPDSGDNTIPEPPAKIHQTSPSQNLGRFDARHDKYH